MSPQQETSRQYKTLIVNIKVFNIHTEELVRDMTKTIDGPERRKWIADTVMWATLNDCFVEICNNDHKEIINAND